MKVICCLLLFILLIKCNEAKKAQRMYVVVRNATTPGKPMYGFRIFDSKEKTCLYRIRVSSSDVDSAILVDNLGKNIMANLKGIWIENLVNVSFSVYDSKLNKWTDGFIKINAHVLSLDYIIQFNNEQLIANLGNFSKKIKVYDKKKNELLAEFRVRSRWLPWSSAKYDLKIYSNQVPDAIHFFLVLIMDHRGLAGDN
ncbi:unnamed protein product [Rotaria sp. Silwood1]|nr:unnamed protein product [Rotaria sp. Silwood1]CAF1606843.1 unnamed protein product [Rotaria sp. Silwood1]CAF3741337.1 unnamed protein product [Rotaria sp. Silwood1]CAF3789137.1 unnamed protein product [Rotaria sp. Silwood1]CAF3807065.1 unnamed protein product [Rotaria sp. Silwood1]